MATDSIPAPTPTHALLLTYRGLRLRVEGSDAAELRWLAEFLVPAFGRDDAGPVDCTVVVDCDPERLATLRAAGAARTAPTRCLVLDTAPLSLPAYASADTCVVLHDVAGVAYVVANDRRRIELVATAADWRRREALMKVVRELAMSSAWSATSLVLHAAACAIDGQAILIAGPKRAGKTSLLLHALDAAGARLLANDRIVLEHDAPSIVAWAMPTIANLRHDTVAARFADAAQRRAAARQVFSLTIAEAEAQPSPPIAPARPLACSPPQLAHLLGVELAGRAAAAALLLPRIDGSARGIELRRLTADEAAAQFPAVLFAAAQMPPLVSEVFAVPSRTHPPDTAALQQSWRASVGALRVFDCRLGPDAYTGDPNAFVSAVLQSA